MLISIKTREESKSKNLEKPYRDADDKLIARILKSQMYNRSVSMRNLESNYD